MIEACGSGRFNRILPRCAQRIRVMRPLTVEPSSGPNTLYTSFFPRPRDGGQDDYFEDLEACKQSSYLILIRWESTDSTLRASRIAEPSLDVRVIILVLQQPLSRLAPT